jgi:hypothetical protein
VALRETGGRERGLKGVNCDRNSRGDGGKWLWGRGMGFTPMNRRFAACLWSGLWEWGRYRAEELGVRGAARRCCGEVAGGRERSVPKRGFEPPLPCGN